MVMLINNSVAHVHIAHGNNAMKIETNMSPVAMWMKNNITLAWKNFSHLEGQDVWSGAWFLFLW